MAAPVNQSVYQFSEDSTHTSGDKGTLALGVRQDSTGGLVSASGDYAPFLVDASGRMKVVQPSSFKPPAAPTVITVVKPGIPGAPVADSAWFVDSFPAANQVASATRAAPGAGRHNVITWVAASYAQPTASTTQPRSRDIQLRHISAGSSSTSYLFILAMGLEDVQGVSNALVMTDVALVANENRSLKLTFNSAGGSGTFQAVAMGGYVTSTT